MAKGLIINSFVFDMADHLDDTEIAEFWGVLAAYYRGDALPEMSKPVAMAFQRVADDNKKFDPEHRDIVSEARSNAAKARWGNGKTCKTMQNDANDANTPKDKDIEKEKDKEIDKKISLSEEGEGAGEGVPKKTMSNDELSQFIAGVMRKGYARDAAIRLVANMGLIDEKEAFYQESPIPNGRGQKV